MEMFTSQPASGAALERAEPSSELASQADLLRWRGWYWAVIPLLATVAYLLVLRVGFLSDDFVLLSQGKESGVDVRVFVPQPHWYLYRPLGMLLVWQVGGQLWGFNPLPFHLQGLLLHAGVSLLLGLWLAEASGRRALGWLGGALFAVFPLHLEAVAWVAAQWDTLAVFFGLLSLWLFTLWWRRSARRYLYIYLLSVLSYGLAIFTKESMLTFLPMFGVSAWLTTPRLLWKRWVRLGIALAPFALILAFNAGLRLVSWGHLGGYGRSRIDYSALLPVVWDQFIGFAKLLLSPINSTVFGRVPEQIVGLTITIALLIGLMRYGWSERRVLLAAGVWIVVALTPVFLVAPTPVLALPVSVAPGDLQNNRFLYLAAGGYCAGVAALLYAAISSARRWRQQGAVLTGLLLLLGLATSWVQLGPWVTAGKLVAGIEQDLTRLVPGQSEVKEPIWYVESVPDNYKGAYLFRLGLGNMRYLTGEGEPGIKDVSNVADASLASSTQEAFALRFGLDEQVPRAWVASGAGITNEVGVAEAASLEATSKSTEMWDFTSCAAGATDGWQVAGARVSCEPGRGLTVRPDGGDPQMLSPSIKVKRGPNSAQYLRLRVAARYPSGSGESKYINQWYWRGPEGAFSEASSKAIPVRRDGNWHVYWTFLPTDAIGGVPSNLRFDPVNSDTMVNMRWIELDVVP